MAKTLHHLPTDIIEVILSRSTVKPLLRFKSVSKSWNSIISDPLFRKTHLDLHICHASSSGGLPLVKLEDQNLEIVRVLEKPYNCKDVLCRYGGVLLLADFHNRNEVLWNPSTQTHETIRIPFQRPYVSGYGLCPDPATDSFKVVVVNGDDYSVYSVKNKSLIIKTKKFDGLYTGYGVICRRRAVCVDGAVYWVRWNVGEIIYFDPRDDKFKVLPKPEYTNKKAKYMYLADLGGSLCLRCWGEDRTRIKMWIKEKGIDNHSWKEFITIENVDVKMDIWNFEPLCFVGNNILFRTESNLVVYSPLEKTFAQFGDTRLNGFGSLRDLVPYRDSPVIKSL